MEDTEQIVKQLEDIKLELAKLRWRTLAMETVFRALWDFSFQVSARMPWQESSSYLLQILSTTQETGEHALRTAEDYQGEGSEEKRELHLKAFAEVMETMRGIFSPGSEDPPQ